MVTFADQHAFAPAADSTFDHEAYAAFLRGKVAVAPGAGWEIGPRDLHPSLKPHQRDGAVWAIRGGRRAVFASFGLGKTRIGLSVCEQTARRYPDKQVLIVAPLGVRREFDEESVAMGMEVTYVRNDGEAAAVGPGGILITNYERVREGDLSADYIAAEITGVWLDEASVLRSYGSKTYQEFTEIFATVPHRWVATATPSPNRTKELTHYAAFLGIMDTGQALTRWFKRNSSSAGDLTLMEHKETEFWEWVASWALFITRPSDLGHSDEGYVLPPIQIHWHSVDVSHEGAGADSWGQAQLFRDATAGVTAAAREKRDTIGPRLAKAVQIMEADRDHGGLPTRWLLWHHLEAERLAIEDRFTRDHEMGWLATAYGSDPEGRDAAIGAFATGEWRSGPKLGVPVLYLATKPEIAGSGTNLQRFCSRAIFLGINYEFNDLIQAVHRIYRFGQREPVQIHIIYAASEMEVVRTLKRKWREHEELTARMREIVRSRGLADVSRPDLGRSVGVVRQVQRGERWVAVNNDCTLELAGMESNSVGMLLTSVPFGDQYEYSTSTHDFGYNDGNSAFLEQLGFALPEMLRVLQPGRVAAVHVKDRIRFGSVTGTGMYSVDPFSDDCLAAFRRAGFIFFGRITITTDVVRENNQTYRLSYGEMLKDGTKMGVGMPEYVLLFRKPQSDRTRSYADIPVAHDAADYSLARWQVDAHGYWRSSGDRLLTSDELAAVGHRTAKAWWEKYNAENVYDFASHVDLGRGLEQRAYLPKDFMLLAPQAPAAATPWVWTDVVRMRTLNSMQSRRRQEAHVCPFQLDTVERLIGRFTSPSDIVLDPFAGYASVGHEAVRMGRRAYMIELHTPYWETGTRYCRAAEEQVSAPKLFDVLDALDEAPSAGGRAPW